MTPASSRLPPHPQPRGSTRPSREPGTHYPRAMPHVYHHDSTSGPGDARGTGHCQACRRRLLHASRQQGRSAAPARNSDNEATSRSTDLGRNRTRAELPAQPNRTRANTGGPSQAGNSAAAAGGDREIIPTATLAAEAATTEAPTMGPTGEPVAEAIAAAEATRTATPPKPHMAASTPARRLKNCGGRSPPP
jgi:hypothetical protein